jgi:hypothetical protein
MKNHIAIILCLVFCSVVASLTSFGQQVQNNQIGKTDPVRAAEGQSKWLKAAFKLDEDTYNQIYRVFLKYELQKDSVIYLSIQDKNKREILFQISQKTKKDLSMILSRQNYSDYLDMLEKTKSNMPWRTSH